MTTETSGKSLDLSAGQLEAVDGKPDTSDIPEAPAESWRHATRFHQARHEPAGDRNP